MFGKSVFHTAKCDGNVGWEIQFYGLRESGYAPAIDLYCVNGICFTVDFSGLYRRETPANKTMDMTYGKRKYKIYPFPER